MFAHTLPAVLLTRSALGAAMTRGRRVMARLAKLNLILVKEKEEERALQEKIDMLL